MGGPAARRITPLVALIDRVLAPESSFQKRFFFLARRFVAGETIDDALSAVRATNERGMSATLDFLGEDVSEESAAMHTRDVYFEILDAIKTSDLDSNVSVKLSALGLLISEDLAMQQLTSILERAAGNGDSFVRIDMEGSACTEATLRIFERVFPLHSNVGPVLQALLKRTPKDIERMIELKARVRLCKGAYKEPSAIAHQAMPTIRREYLKLAERVLTAGNYPGLATHDVRLIGAIKRFTKEHGIAPDRFEFQMLYGVRPHIQRELVAQGYRVRIYIPFGTHWAGYFYRRVLERKENALFALSSIFSR
ncbi:MAG: proline dehydrogenase family protein [Candidatus Eremiobacteraeota bacterium]|nr:proline dehydrogenase family protein [Candidatus Eremiobacteraeota bacterium]